MSAKGSFAVSVLSSFLFFLLLLRVDFDLELAPHVEKLVCVICKRFFRCVCAVLHFLHLFLFDLFSVEVEYRNFSVL